VRRSFENGGATHAQAHYFVNALYRVGMTNEADRVLQGLSSSLASGAAFGGCGTGMEWRSWDGLPTGYEGILTDQFGVLALIVDRYGSP